MSFPLKRHSSAESTQRSKLARVADTLSDWWEMGSTVLQKHRLRSQPQGNIVTSRQLEEYYEKVKRENSVLYSRLEENSQSSQLSQQNTGLSLDKEQSTMVTASAPVSARVSRKPSRQLLRTATSYNSLRGNFGIDPLERAQLVQLKKRMSADRYRKARMGYMRSHTQNLVHTKRSVSLLGYVDSGVNTLEEVQVPSRKRKAVPEGKRNKEGFFKLDLSYAASDHEDEEEEVKPIESKPVTEKLKLNGRKSAFSLKKPKSFVPVKMESVKDEELAVKPSAGFSFGSKEEKHVTFEAEKKTEKTETKPESKPAFSFGQKESESSTASKPAFSFGAKNDSEKPKPAPAFSFNTDKSEQPVLKKDEKKDTPAFSFGKPDMEKKPAFEFGKKDSEQKPAFSFGKSDSENKPVFAVGDTTKKVPAFSFGKSDSDKKDPAKPSFSFLKATPAAPSFSFSDAKKSEKSAPEKSKSAKPVVSMSADKKAPAFAFNPPKETSNKDSKSVAAPAFAFGKSQPSAGFQFGKQDSKPEAAKSADAPKPFIFGQKGDKPVEKPAFKFGEPAKADESAKSEKPAFQFGKTAQTDSKPAFSFGNSAKSDSKPAFQFGKSAEKPAEKIAEKAAEQPAFKFGETKSSDSKPTFSFGGQSAKTESKPAFGNAPTSFNFTPTPAQPATPSNGFSFAAAPSKPAEKPAEKSFGFGNVSLPAKPAFGFNQSQPSSRESSEQPGGSRKKRSSASAPPTAFSLNAGSQNGFSFGSQPSRPSNGFNFAGNGNSGANPGLGSGSNGRSSSVPPSSSNGNGFGSGFGNGFGSQNGQNGQSQQSNGFNFNGNGNGNNAANSFGGSQNQSSSMFNLNQFPSMPPANFQNGGFNFNQSQPAAQQQQQQQQPSFNFNKSATPDINFAGSNAGMDPSAIFSAPPSMPTHHRRPRLAPRPLRRR